MHDSTERDDLCNVRRTTSCGLGCISTVDSRNHPTLCISGVSVVSVMANFKGKAPLQVRSDASGEELVEEGVECSGRLVLVGELGAAEPEHLIAGQP